MQRYAALLLLATACALACTTATSPSPRRGERRTVLFFCDDGERIEVRFDSARDVAVLVRDENEIELRREPAASGFRYGNGRNRIRGQEGELIVEIGRMAPLRCEAAG